ncbi:translation initiation factor IF-2 [Lyngbya confervoides]|uniref:Translation initiation factor IF-2 n=1 Tax=Lyngbya confervoides BDU141951 TaxID=1574623 RepID=A0ABD4T2A0_9CYAN|nr:translation initiation factor IF-2 [Lyngbya confervoides]MCM1982715.1 translation initiation factor IF-2 [Lyngbya confervoides BDU141951]
MSTTTRVRIYELSKELELENKEILHLCEQLNIAVKSHSSTITEAEAAAIRSAAPSFDAGAETKPARSKPQKKGQQILEIRKQPDEEGESPTPPLAKPEIVKPSGPSKPSRPNAAPELVKPPVAKPARSEAGTKPSASSAPSEPEKKLSPPPQLKSKPVPGHEKASATAQTPPVKPTKPKRKSPTSAEEVKQSRPQEAAPASAAKTVRQRPEPAPTLLGKPKLSRPKVTAESLVSVQPKQEAIAVDKPRSPESSREEKLESSPETPILQDKPRPQPKPVRPVRKKSEAGGSEVELVAVRPRATVEEEAGSDAVLPKLQHKPKRSSKRGSKEEDEMEELKLKSPTKQKRRGPKTEDEDDDLFAADSNLAAQSTAVDVSQSLVRPPKPSSGKTSKPSSQPAVKASSSRGGGSRSRRRDRQQKAETVERPSVIAITDDLTVKELANLLTVSEIEIIKNLFLKGIAANINQTLDLKTATTVAEEFEVEVETPETESKAKKLTEMLDVADLDNLVRRPPVVTIMGHVDHGKTTLLDAIRETKVAQGEAGGITQHIGAYHVDLDHNGEPQQVVFLDTPGHEAFTAMRARGARVTDIAILVVAADDGVRPQTLEAMRHAQAAEVPIIVAINKMDKEGAQPDRVKQELAEHNLVAEEWGGDAIMVPVSALKGENLDSLLEMILLVAEVEDLHANPDRLAKGTVIEAHLDKAKGPVATLLVQNGTLRVGDIVVAGSVFGKVRAMVDDRGERVESASPSFAVEILGMNDVPAAGDEFDVYADEKEARNVAETRSDKQRQARLTQSMGARRVSLGALSEQALEGDLKELNIILKTDVQGSVEAILSALGQLPQREVQLRTLLAAPGEITETDVDLASASNAVILGFNTSLASGARQAADEAGIDIRDYSVIYKLLEDIEGAMEGLLDPEMVEEPLGQAEVRAVFAVGRGAVAGCYVQSGKLQRNCRIRVHRGSEKVYEGVLDSLKRMREDAREVNTGYECGVGVDDFNAWTEGDIIEAYQLVSKRRTLSH